MPLVRKRRTARPCCHPISETAPLVVFFLVSAGVFLAFDWPALLREIILSYLVAFIVVRAVMAIARLLLSPSGVATPAGEKKPLRLIPASDVEADFWYRRVAVFTGYFMAGWATVSLLPALGFPADATRLIAYLLGIGLLVLAVEVGLAASASPGDDRANKHEGMAPHRLPGSPLGALGR